MSEKSSQRCRLGKKKVQGATPTTDLEHLSERRWHSPITRRALVPPEKRVCNPCPASLMVKLLMAINVMWNGIHLPGLDNRYDAAKCFSQPCASCQCYGPISSYGRFRLEVAFVSNCWYYGRSWQLCKNRTSGARRLRQMLVRRKLLLGGGRLGEFQQSAGFSGSGAFLRDGYYEKPVKNN